MTRKGFTLVEILIVVGIISILSTFTLIHLVRARMQANEAIAIRRLYDFARAVEGYALDNGDYPTDDPDLLVSATPPYYKKNICDGNPRAGYLFSISDADLYTLDATPVDCNRTGSKDFTITAGLRMSESDCVP